MRKKGSIGRWRDGRAQKISAEIRIALRPTQRRCGPTRRSRVPHRERCRPRPFSRRGPRLVAHRARGRYAFRRGNDHQSAEQGVHHDRCRAAFTAARSSTSSSGGICRTARSTAASARVRICGSGGCGYRHNPEPQLWNGRSGQRFRSVRWHADLFPARSCRSGNTQRGRRRASKGRWITAHRSRRQPAGGRAGHYKPANRRLGNRRRRALSARTVMQIGGSGI